MKLHVKRFYYAKQKKYSIFCKCDDTWGNFWEMLPSDVAWALSQSCGLESLDSDSSPKFEDLWLDIDFDNNDSRLDLDLSPLTRQVFVFPKKCWLQLKDYKFYSMFDLNSLPD